MKKTNKKTTKKSIKKHQNKSWLIYILIGFVSLVAVVLLALLVVYTWPLRNSALQQANVQSLSFEQATKKVETIQANELKQGIKPECQTKLLSHGKKTAKSVVMYHGVSSCSYQFSDLAQYFYNQGYNVYAPTAPKHGLVDHKTYSTITSEELVDFANQSANIATAIGDDVGAIGMSGGGMLASWTTQYHTHFSRMLVLSPFFEPARKQAAAYKIKPFLLLYGNRIIPDTYSVSEDGGEGLSYYALTQFAIVGKNLPEPARKTDLQSVGLVMAEDDEQINQPMARAILSDIADKNQIKLSTYDIPASWHIQHVTVGPENKNVQLHRDVLYQKYFDMYSR